MYELMILSIFMRQSAYGYLIAKIINDLIGPYARLSNGRLYPLLAQLEKQGLIETVHEPGSMDKRGRKYHITGAGRERFHTLMMDTASYPREYEQVFLQKILVLRFLRLSERLYLLDHYVTYCRAHILHLTDEIEDLRTNAQSKGIEPEQVPVTINAMEHLIKRWQGELEWASSLRESEQRKGEGLESQKEEREPMT